MKQRIQIEGDLRKPTVLFDPEKGLLEITGRSTTENSIAFYQPLYDWVNGYIERPAGSTTVNIRFEYFNTSTSRWIFKILKRLEIAHEKTQNVKINWYHSDDDILDAGEDFRS
ncbi:MAG: DUF1987 domain-containing protein, partial [Bacteroidetes bacterium]|nr:DUF1987 domain-containing protein [Bacteroidota bacterium]